jgi:hypothetical protein
MIQMSDFAGNPRAPAAPATRARYRQSADQPSRRQRKTVSGWTMIRLSRHCGHQRENKIQNSRSQRRKHGDEFGCARARRFDAAAIDSNSSAARVRVSLPGASENDALVAVPIACRLPPTHQNHQPIRADQVVRNHSRSETLKQLRGHLGPDANAGATIFDTILVACQTKT